MTDEATTPYDPDDPLHEAVASFEAAKDAGLDPDPREWLQRYPDVAERLAQYFADRERIKHLAASEVIEEDLPESIGRYRVLRGLEQGGFGAVYLARDEELDRLVAIKVPRPDRVPPIQVPAFLAEARVLASLDHPNIVPVYDAGETPDGGCFLVSKFIEGGDLARRMQSQPLSRQTAVLIVAKVADALHYAHKRGIVHRDVKPGNVLLDAEGTPYVGDFGLALREQDFGNPRSQGGTVGYMSPEQARREGHLVDGRSDIYSLGAMLYELLSGSKVVRSSSPAEQVEEILHVPPKPLRQIDDSIPADLERICLKCLAKHPAERYSTAGDVARDLKRWLARQQAGSSRRWWLAAATGCLLAGAALGVAYYFRPPPAPSPTPSPEKTVPLVQRVELIVRRERDDTQLDAKLVLAGGVEQDFGRLNPLKDNDDFKLFVEFNQATSWYLVQVDPDGDAAVLDRSKTPQSKMQFPGRGNMAHFNPNDRKGDNLLLLLAGNMPPEMSEPLLAKRISSLGASSTQDTSIATKLRAGVTIRQSLVPLPQERLSEIEGHLPQGLKPAHAIILRTGDE